MPWWLIGFSMTAACTSTDSANLFTEIIRKDGLAGNWVWWAFLITSVFTVFIYSKLWVRTGVTTDVEFYELRYSGMPAAFLRALRGVYLGVILNLLVMGAVVLGGLKIGVVLFGCSSATVLVFTGVFSIVYVAIAGLHGAVYYAIRPWPWYIVGFCSLIVFPELADIQRAFPSVDPKLVGGDMAYSAMLTKVPHGWFVVVAAAMMAALFSTVAAHLTMGWMRINAWSEIVGILAALLAAVVLELVLPRCGQGRPLDVPRLRRHLRVDGPCRGVRPGVLAAPTPGRSRRGGPARRRAGWTSAEGRGGGCGRRASQPPSRRCGRRAVGRSSGPA